MLRSHLLASHSRSGTLDRMRLAISTATEQALSSDQPLVLCLRQHVLESINDAITYGWCSQEELAAAVAVAAGWEGEFGDPKMCLLHHQAFHDIIHRIYSKAGAEQTVDLDGRSMLGQSASRDRSSGSSAFEPSGLAATYDHV